MKDVYSSTTSKSYFETKMHWNYRTNGTKCPTCDPHLIMTTLENPSGTIHHSNYIMVINELCVPTSTPDINTYLSNLCNELVNDSDVTWATTWTAHTQADVSFTYTGVAG